MTTAILEKFLETICTFENLASFSDVNGFGGDELENFMKTNCLQTALIHNKKSKIREHIISLVNDEKKDISDNLIAIFRPLILMKKANMKQLHKYYCAQTEKQKLDFVCKLILLQKEKRTHPRCPIITFLGSL